GWFCAPLRPVVDRRLLGDSIERPDLDVPPAAFLACGVAAAAVDLDGDRALFGEGLQHGLAVVLRNVSSGGVEHGDLLAVEGGRHLRVLPAFDADEEVIPVVNLPRGKPLAGGAGTDEADVGGLLLVDRLQRDELAVSFLALQAERAGEPAASRFAVEVADVAAVVVVDGHLDALALVSGAKEEAGVDAPRRFHFEREFEVAELAIGKQDAAIAGAGGVLLAGENAVGFDGPLAAGAVA